MYYGEDYEGSNDFVDNFLSAGEEDRVRNELHDTQRLLRLLDQKIREAGGEPRKEFMKVSITGDEDAPAAKPGKTWGARRTGVYTVKDLPQDGLFDDLFGSGGYSEHARDPDEPYLADKGRRLRDGEIVEFAPSIAERAHAALDKASNVDFFFVFVLAVFLFALWLGTRAGYRKGILFATKKLQKEQFQQQQQQFAVLHVQPMNAAIETK